MFLCAHAKEINSLLEEGEVYTPVAAMFYKARMLRKVVRLAVLKNKESPFFQQVSTQDDIWKLGDLRQNIRWIGKDEIKLLTTLCKKLKDITTNGQSRSILQLIEKLFNKVVVTSIEFNADDASTTSTDEF